VVAGVFIILFAVIFFVNDGRGIWSWLVGLLPREARAAADGSGQRAWAVLTSYVRATVIIATVDAIGIALGALALRLPFVLPIAVLVFLGAFVPVVGAAISGTAAVAVALVTHGPVAALIMLAIVVGVQQLESHILQPFLMGRMVRVHPLAVVLVIAVGGLSAGIFGALIAVPLAAVINSVGAYLAGRRGEADVKADAGAATDVPARLH
jgi:predicted PurR-regulated permease PerM